MNLGENIYRLRTEQGMSQEALAAALEVSRQSVSKWENNSAVPELEKLIKMSEVFGVTLDQLVGKEAPTPPPAPAPEVIIQEAAPPHRTIGVILLCFGMVSTAMSVVPPPISTTKLPIGSYTGSPVPSAAAKACSTTKICLAPIRSMALITARRSTLLTSPGIVTTIRGRTKWRVPIALLTK